VVLVGGMGKINYIDLILGRCLGWLIELRFGGGDLSVPRLCSFFAAYGPQIQTNSNRLEDGDWRGILIRRFRALI
jgi:hypothetical protein